MQRRYLVRVRGTPGPDLPAKLLRGVHAGRWPGPVQPRWRQRGRSEGHTWFEVSLGEGRNREVRRVFEALGHEVSRLKRLTYGPFVLPEDLAPGKCLQLSPAQVAEHMARL